MPTGWRKNYDRYRKMFLNVSKVYNQKPDVKAFLEIILTLFILVFFGVFALRPTILTITDLLKQIETKREVNQKLETKIRNLQTAQTLAASQSDNILLLDTAVPSLPLPDDFSRQVEGIAQQTSSQVLGISTSDFLLSGKEEQQRRKDKELEPLPGGAKEMPFTISVSGSYDALKQFLSNFEGMRRPPKIDSATFNLSETNEGSELVLIISGRLPYIQSK